MATRRYGTKRHSAGFDELVDMLAKNEYPLEYLHDRRAALEAQGIKFPEDFNEALAEERAENPKYRGKAVPKAPRARGTKTPPTPPRARTRKRSMPKTTPPELTTPSTTAAAKKPRAPRTARTTATKRKTTSSATTTHKPASNRTTTTQNKRLNRANAYAFVAQAAEHILSSRSHEPDVVALLRAIAAENRKAGEQTYATFKAAL